MQLKLKNVVYGYVLGSIAYVAKRGELMHRATPPIGSEFQLLLPLVGFFKTIRGFLRA